MKQILSLSLAACLSMGLGAPVLADGQSVDAAIGGALGGGLGAYIGNEVAGRGGAIVGGAVGAATGAAITTDDHRHYPSPPPRYAYPPPPRTYYYQSPPRHFCPPGQAKKGRC